MSENNKLQFLFSIIKAVATAIIITLFAVLIFGVIAKFATINFKIIKVINQFIKVLSVFLGCFMFVRENKGLVKGLIVGLSFSLIIYLIFALIGKELSFKLSFLIDIAFCLVMGAISGVIAVNVKKR